MRARLTKADGIGRPAEWRKPLAKSKADAIARDTKGSLRKTAKRHNVGASTVADIRHGRHWATRSAQLPAAIKGHPGW